MIASRKSKCGAVWREGEETHTQPHFLFWFIFGVNNRSLGRKQRWCFRTGECCRERGRGGRKRKDKTRGPQMPRRQREPPASLVTRVVDWVFTMLRNAEFEILFFLFFVIAFLLFKDLTARPEYNQILSKKGQEGDSRLFWPMALRCLRTQSRQASFGCCTAVGEATEHDKLSRLQCGAGVSLWRYRAGKSMWLSWGTTTSGLTS